MGWNTRAPVPEARVSRRALAAQIPAGIVGDGHHQDRIDNRVGILRRFEGVRVLLDAGGIAAVGNRDDHMAAFASIQIARSQMHGVVQRSSGARLQRLAANRSIALRGA